MQIAASGTDSWVPGLEHHVRHSVAAKFRERATRVFLSDLVEQAFLHIVKTDNFIARECIVDVRREVVVPCKESVGGNRIAFRNLISGLTGYGGYL
jgi:hypothetical protein